MVYCTTYLTVSSGELLCWNVALCGLALVYFGDTVVRLAFLCTTRGWLAVYLLLTGVHNSRVRLRPARPNYVRWRLILVFAYPVWNLLHVTRLESRIWRWLLGYRKICALLAVGG